MAIMNTDLVVRLRRIVAEPTDVTYTDAILWSMIEEEAVGDSVGHSPDNADWTPTYNLFRVAGHIWAEKASAYVEQHDFSADGGNFARSQKYQNALKQSAYYYSKAKVTSLKFIQSPIVTGLNEQGYEDFPYKDGVDDDNILYIT